MKTLLNLVCLLCFFTAVQATPPTIEFEPGAEYVISATFPNGQGTVTGTLKEGAVRPAGLKGSQSKNEELGYQINLEVNWSGLSGPLQSATLSHPSIGEGQILFRSTAKNNGVYLDLNPISADQDGDTAGSMSREINIHYYYDRDALAAKAFQSINTGNTQLVSNLLNGQVIITLTPTGGNPVQATLQAVNANTIPTMGQWALFILGLCLSSAAVVYIGRKKITLAE